MPKKFPALLALLLLLAPATAPAREQNPDSLAVSSAQWETSTVAPGVTHRRARLEKFGKGPQHVNIIEVRQGAPGVAAAIVTRKGGGKTSALARACQAAAAINGSYFDMKTRESTCYLRIDGRVLSESMEGATADRLTGAILIQNGQASLIPWNASVESVFNAPRCTVLASGPLLLHNGKTCDWSGVPRSLTGTRHPRAALGTTGDGRLLLVTADGRLPGATGLTIPELARLMKTLGCRDALNLDGGGSTTLHARSAAGGGVLNWPCDNKLPDHDGERAVANAIVILAPAGR